MYSSKILIIFVILIIIFKMNNLDFLKKQINKLKTKYNLVYSDKIFIKNNNITNNDNDKFNLTEFTENSDELNVSDDTKNIINNLHKEYVKNNNIYFNIKINNNLIGKLIFKLFNNELPITCQNIINLCRNKAYNNCKFHRLVKNFCIQGGDITNNNGTGGISIYGNNFNDENFKIKHNKKGIISMANKGPNTNNSQFFITFKELPELDDKHVAFGEIIEGYEILDIFNNLNTNNENPIDEIIIEDCGLI